MALDQKFAEVFRPVFHLHSQERYGPSSIDYILDNSTLFSGKGEIVVDRPSVAALLEAQYRVELSDLRLNLHEAARPGPSHLHEVPVYAHVRRGGVPGDYQGIDIVYAAYFAYRGPHNVPTMSDRYKGPMPTHSGAHDVDVAHVTVRLRRKHGRVSQHLLLAQDYHQLQPIDYEIDSVYFGAYGFDEGSWTYTSKGNNNKQAPRFTTTASDLNRVNVYVAVNSHALYAEPRKYCRVLGLSDDFTDNSGAQWDVCRHQVHLVHVPKLMPTTPQQEVVVGKDCTSYKKLIPLVSPAFMQYTGAWNSHGLQTLTFQRWMYDESRYSQTNWSRVMFNYGL